MAAPAHGMRATFPDNDASRPAATPPLDLDWVRARFPALDTEWALMDNAGGSATLATVAERVADYMRHRPVQLGASYALSAEAGARQVEARRALADLFATAGGRPPAPGQVAIGPSSTALFSRLARALAPGLKAGDEIIVTDADHEANIGPWLRLETLGVRLRWWRIRPDSMRLELEDLDGLLNERTRLVCFTHASNVLGSVMDIGPVIERVRAAGARSCVDGVAYAAHRGLAFSEWRADWYAFTLYKVFGPHSALLCTAPDAVDALANLNHEWLTPPDAAGRLEPGAWSYELAWGAAAVPDYLRELGAHHQADPFACIAAHESKLTAHVLDWLRDRPGVRVIGDAEPGPARLPTISFRHARRKPHEIVEHVDRARVGIRHGHFYAPRLIEALGLPRQEGVVRISLAHYNTPAEIERLIGALENVL